MCVSRADTIETSGSWRVCVCVRAETVSQCVSAREPSATATTFAVDILQFYFVRQCVRCTALDKTNEISKRISLFIYLRIKIAGSAKLKRSSVVFHFYYFFCFFGQVTTGARRIRPLCVRDFFFFFFISFIRFVCQIKSGRVREVRNPILRLHKNFSLAATSEFIFCVLFCFFPSFYFFVFLGRTVSSDLWMSAVKTLTKNCSMRWERGESFVCEFEWTAKCLATIRRTRIGNLTFRWI